MTGSFCNLAPQLERGAKAFAEKGKTLSGLSANPKKACMQVYRQSLG